MSSTAIGVRKCKWYTAVGLLARLMDIVDGGGGRKIPSSRTLAVPVRM